jgi:hypothetical protein
MTEDTPAELPNYKTLASAYLHARRFVGAIVTCGSDVAFAETSVMCLEKLDAMVSHDALFAWMADQALDTEAEPC